ncbi:MAG: hypothetical protein H6745_13430 [Deltaproteobacteria bacterium]|nr:hypothetical protein [Deltaproteobacteria bacterium]
MRRQAARAVTSPRRPSCAVWGALAVPLALLFGLGATPARAEGGVRYTTVFEELEGDAPRASSAAELAAIEAMRRAGVVFIDEAQARRIRSVNDAGALVTGQVSPVITPADADVLIAARCRLSPVTSALTSGTAYRYEARLEAKVIDVGTGQVLGAHFAAGQSRLRFSPDQALEEAARDAGQKLAAELLAARPAPDADRVELTVRGLPNVTAGQRVVAGVRAVPGVVSATVLSQNPSLMVVDVRAPGRAAPDLAVALDAARGLGLVATGFSARRVVCDYSAEAAAAFDVVLTPFEARAARAGDGWLATALPEIVGAALENRAFVTLRGGGPRPLPAAPAAWPKALAARGATPKATLVVAGSYTRDNDGGVAVTVRVRAGQGGAVVLTDQLACPDLACVARLGDHLGESLMPALLAKRHLFADAVPAGLAAAPEPPRALSITPPAGRAIFPALYRPDAPGWTATVKNEGAAPVTAVVLRASLSGLTPNPVDQVVGDLAPGEAREVPVRLVLDGGALSRRDRTAAETLTLTVDYRVGELAGRESRSAAVMVFDRSALSWTDPDSVAAFVRPRSDAVQAVARAVAHAAPADADPITLGGALFAALGALDLRYQRDPASPFSAEATNDYLQLPEETLARKSGDCDDLAVLYASLAEALDLPAALLVTPDHVLVAVSTGVPARNRGAPYVIDGERRLLEHDGVAWLPLETTLLGASVADAWDAGAKVVAEKRAALRVVVIRDAWKTAPPTGLDAGATPPALDAARLTERVQRALADFEGERKRAVDAALARVGAGGGPGALLERAVMLVLAGRLDEARALLEKLEGDAAMRRAALNNIGNVELLAGRLAEARGAYDAALKLEPSDARVHLNAAIAAWLAGDEAAFDEHLVGCLTNGGDDLVVALSRAAVGGAAGTRGAAARGPALRGIDGDIARALARRGRPAPTGLRAAPTPSRTRASDARGGRPDALGHQLCWLLR